MLQANYSQETTYHLEQAVKDAQKAAEFDPSDPMIKASLAKWSSELSQQNSKDRKSFKNIFKHGELYTADEIERAGSSGRAGGLNDIQQNQAGAHNHALGLIDLIGNWLSIAMLGAH